jgi:hypothetical protein
MLLITADTLSKLYSPFKTSPIEYSWISKAPV